jgi:hypothetical protein
MVSSVNQQEESRAVLQLQANAQFCCTKVRLPTLCHCDLQLMDASKEGKPKVGNV